MMNHLTKPVTPPTRAPNSVSTYHSKKQPVSYFLNMDSSKESFMKFVGRAGAAFVAVQTAWGLIGNYWNFPRGIDHNVNKLKRKRDQLNAQKEDIESIIKPELRPGKKVKQEVQLYFEDVKRTNGEINNLESKVGASNFFYRGFLVKQVCKMDEEVGKLLKKGEFSDDLVVNNLSRIGQVLETPSFVVDKIELIKHSVMRYLRNDEVRKIGVYGMVGVGKTTVLKLVNNELLKGLTNIDILIWVTLSREFSVIELQKKIAEAMDVVITVNEDQTLIAGMLSEILTEKGRFVLILDGVWERFSLEEVGIPMSFGGKLLLTTSSLDVCRQMDCEVIKMEPFLKADAWALFLNNVGHNLINSADLQQIATSIVERCAGLASVIVAVAGNVKGEKSLPIWRNVLVELKRSILESVKDKVYPQLRFSYDRLKDPGIQKCFLTCASYREDSAILKEQLIRDWIEKGLIEEMGSNEANMDKGQAILRKLVDNCLLENVGNERVKMHDLVIDMTKLITQDLNES